jgi:protein SCO1/2
MLRNALIVALSGAALWSVVIAGTGQARAASQAGPAVSSPSSSGNAVAAPAAATKAAESGSDAGPDFAKALAVSQAVIGTQPRNHVLRDVQRRDVRFEQYRGKPLLVSFVYTGCFQVCPVTTQFLARAVRSARQALGRDSFNVLTIGFNQPFDTPDAMAAFARQNGIDDARWTFLGTDAATVPELARDFGFTFYPTPKGFDHITQVTVLDAEGTIYRQVYGDTFELQMLVEPIKDLLSGQARRAEGLEAVWTKVKLFCTVYDPTTGGYRANYSLFVEIFAGLTIVGAVIGFLVSQRRRRPRPA